ncbi:hypothetical protein [Shewanella algae]|nr:hypothetical protein [Shewanella algae]
MTIKTGGFETIPGKFKPRKRLAGKDGYTGDFSGNKEIAAPEKAI